MIWCILGFMTMILLVLMFINMVLIVIISLIIEEEISNPVDTFKNAIGGIA